MIVCPVCEHAQVQGNECEVCGRAFGAAEAVPPPAPLDGLERTAQDAADAGGIALLAELEPTVHAPAPTLAGEVLDLEATAAPAVTVDVAAAPDVERTHHLDLPVDDAFALPPLPVCRYCRTPATADERICARCGMRLAASAGPPPAAEEGEGRRCSCGAPPAPGAGRCPGCGARAR